MAETEVFQPEKSECMRKELSQCADKIQIAGTIIPQDLQSESTVLSIEETSIVFKKLSIQNGQKNFPGSYMRQMKVGILLCTLCMEILKYSSFRNSP